MAHTSLTQRAFLVCFALATWACHGDPIEPIDGQPLDGAGGHGRVSCYAGETRSCNAGGDCQGAQTCDSGEWLECVCPAGTGGFLGGVGGGSSQGGGASGGGAVGGYDGAGGGPIAIPPFRTRLNPLDGWVDGGNNSAGIQGAMYYYADNTTAQSITSDFTGNNACIAGVGPWVDLDCGAPDCYGEYWGAAIALNLNQPIDPVTMVASEAQPFDAASRGIVGFAFDLTGAAIPGSMRFIAEDLDGQYCTGAAQPLLPGANLVLFSELMRDCWNGFGEPPDTSAITKIAWQVVTNTSSETPFDYCISNISPVSR